MYTIFKKGNQFALIQPKIIVCLGAIATNRIISDQWRITRDRGKWIKRKGCLITATFHPAAVLRDEGKKQYIIKRFTRSKKGI